jgi:hypothetical protein
VEARDALLTQMNAQGARGFVYVSGIVLDNNTPGNTADDLFANLYAKDSTTTYTYEILDTPATKDAFVAQMNAQGTRGYVFYGPTTAGTIYVKESGSTTYSYEVLSAAGNTTNAGFLTQVNAQGDRGFGYIGSYIFGLNAADTVNFYGKVTGSAAKYSYRLEPLLNAPDTFIAQANAQGLQGFKFQSGAVFTGEPANSGNQFKALYVKDTSQSATFDWKAISTVSTPMTFVNQANNEAASGYIFLSGYVFVDGPTNIFRNLYFKAANCTGPLCRISGPF